MWPRIFALKYLYYYIIKSTRKMNIHEPFYVKINTQLIKEAIQDKTFNKLIEEANSNNKSCLAEIIHEELGISSRREGYTKYVIQKIEQLYNETKGKTSLSKWVSFALGANLSPIAERLYNSIEGTQLQFDIKYGAVDLEVNAFCIESPDNKWYKKHIDYFNFNGGNEEKDPWDIRFKHKIYLTLPRIRNNFDNIYVAREVAHELTHIDQKVYSQKEVLKRGEEFINNYNKSITGNYNGPAKYSKFYDMCSGVIHDACDFELTAIIQASYRQIMSLLERYWDGNNKKAGLTMKGLNFFFTQTGAYDSLQNMIQLKEYIKYNNNEELEKILKDSYNYNINQFIKICDTWIKKYRDKIGRMYGKIQGEMDAHNVISYGHFNHIIRY